MAWNQWEDRNRAVHDGPTVHDHWNHLVHQEFEEGDAGFLPQDRHWLRDEQAILESTTDQKQAWILAVAAARERATVPFQTQHANDATSRQRQFMNAWLHPSANNT